MGEETVVYIHREFFFVRKKSKTVTCSEEHVKEEAIVLNDIRLKETNLWVFSPMHDEWGWVMKLEGGP